MNIDVVHSRDKYVAAFSNFETMLASISDVETNNLSIKNNPITAKDIYELLNKITYVIRCELEFRYSK